MRYTNVILRKYSTKYDALHLLVSRSFDLTEGHLECEKHVVMLGRLFKAVLREEGATHFQNGKT